MFSSSIGNQISSGFSAFGLNDIGKGALPNRNFGSINDTPVNEPAASHRSCGIFAPITSRDLKIKGYGTSVNSISRIKMWGSCCNSRGHVESLLAA